MDCLPVLYVCRWYLRGDNWFSGLGFLLDLYVCAKSRCGGTYSTIQPSDLREYNQKINLSGPGLANRS
jgi:hypothetical protein